MASIMTIRAPDELQRTLKEYAKQFGYPRNALVLQILQEWVNKKEIEGKGEIR